MKNSAYSILYLLIYTSASQSSKLTPFQRISGARYTSDLGTSHVNFEAQCVHLCTSTDTCLTVSYSRKSRQCNLGASVPRTDQLSLVPDWEFFYNADSDSTYMLVSQEMTWENANRHCQTTYSGHLAHIKTERRMNDLISEMDKDPSTVNKPAWIGATDTVTEGTWLWTDNTPIADGYTDWNPSQPDNNNNEEHCMMIYGKDINYLWNDIICNRELRSICQYSISD